MTKYTFFSFPVKIASKIDVLLVQESSSLYFFGVCHHLDISCCDALSFLPSYLCLQWLLLKETCNMTREIGFSLNYVKVFRGRFNYVLVLIAWTRIKMVTQTPNIVIKK